MAEIERQQAQGKEVAFRGDAAFARPEIYEAHEARQVKYAIRLPANANLERKITKLLIRPVGRPSYKPVVRYKSFLYQAASWTKARRVVAKVEFHFGELFPGWFIVTNFQTSNRAVVRFYNQRGTAEQWTSYQLSRVNSGVSRAARLRSCTSTPGIYIPGRIRAPAPDHRTEPTPPMSFLRHRESIAWLSKGPDGKPVILSFPSGHAMSSSRLFLSGLLSSRARLRFAGLSNCRPQNTSRYKWILHRLESRYRSARLWRDSVSHFMLWPAHCSWDRTRSGAVEGCKRG